MDSGHSYNSCATTTYLCAIRLTLMKKHLLQVLLAMALLSQACQSTSQSEKTNLDSTLTAAGTSAVPPASAAALSSRLRDIGLTTDSDWRGIRLGDAAATVKEKEKATLFETDAKHLGYTVEFANLESIDMLYLLGANQTVSGIEVDLYLNDAQSVDAYQTDLKRYFDARYKATATAGTWQGDRGQTITLKNVSKGKDYGLKVRIAGSTSA